MKNDRDTISRNKMKEIFKKEKTDDKKDLLRDVWPMNIKGTQTLSCEII